MRCTCRFILRAAWLARTSTSAVRTGRCSAFVVSPSSHELPASEYVLPCYWERKSNTNWAVTSGISTGALWPACSITLSGWAFGIERE